MKDKILGILMIALIVIAGIFWFQKRSAEKEAFRAQQEIRKKVIAEDSLVKLSNGYYQKLVADTLTKQQLVKLAADIVELKNRKPVSVTTTIIKPVEIIKETDNISVKQDSVFIKDFYPNKDNPFLKYSNRFSLKTQKGLSTFSFDTISLKQVVTKKENGLYQIDFKGPDFLELKSIDIQTEPIVEPVKDNWGTLIGVDYGTNLDKVKNIDNFVELSVYQRYKKFYLGVGVTTNKDVKGGIKIEF